MRTLLGLLLVPLFGCGPILDAEMDATWDGLTVVSIAGRQPTNHLARVRTEIHDGIDLIVHNACLDGNGALRTRATGSRLAEFSGESACPATTLADCSTAVLTYTSAIVAMHSNGSISMSSFGAAAGCGAAWDVAVTFNGTK